MSATEISEAAVPVEDDGCPQCSEEEYCDACMERRWERTALSTAPLVSTPVTRPRQMLREGSIDLKNIDRWFLELNVYASRMSEVSAVEENVTLEHATELSVTLRRNLRELDAFATRLEGYARQ
ncbi:hypothetical protein [Streptomyces subrutilus]|uniref:Uncharacterized protein n=1 Tax=Streptomyces subrutilus TaxID=36818 RepID=A0A1E5PX81_9ACTN|nr:hypothetical protein [Streptomyces subrutilus]OEJ34169.1 hypothetical protein BGK67_25065 [Streptomyces subrutilus]